MQNTIFKLHEKISDLQKKVDAFSAKEESKIDKPKQAEKPIEEVPKEKTPEIIHAIADKPIEGVAKIRQKPLFEPIQLSEENKISQKSWWENFKENNPDLEKFIGENLINKIGILILVLGISFFVKYAIDKEWINETARVGIGILAGSLVMFFAHKLRLNYKAFSSVLVAGAISIFYFTIAIAFHEYQLFSQTLAFVIMVLITIFSVLVSVSYNRQELAVLSLIGGFAVPFMVSTGQGNYIVLFTYIAILNFGILAIAYFKKWNLVSILAFFFTIILFSSWYSSELYDNKLPHLGSLLFATLFYFIFSLMAVINNIRNKGAFSKMEYFIMVANTFVYFGLGLGIIHNWGIEVKGIFTLSLAIYNLIYATILYKKFGIDKNAIYLLIGLVLTFVTLTIPIQFKGNYITLFWAAEAVLLFWMSQKSTIGFFKIGAIIVQMLTIISLFLDWQNNYIVYVEEVNYLINPVFLTGLFVVASFVVTYKLLQKEGQPTAVFSASFDPVFYRNALALLSIFIGYFVGIFEISYQASSNLINEYASFSISVTYHFVFSAVLVYFGMKYYKEKYFKPMLFLICANIFLYIVWFYDIPTNELVHFYSSNKASAVAFVLHYIIFCILIYFMILVAKEILNGIIFKLINSKIVVWLLVFCGVYILSYELMVHSLYFSDSDAIRNELNEKIIKLKYDKDDFYSKVYLVEDIFESIKIQVIKIGYPILWGIISFALLIFGIKNNWKQIRIISLTLLGLTVVKLFAYDINNVSETGKIVAFILLGILILIISFVYQKIKKLVIDETEKTNSNE